MKRIGGVSSHPIVLHNATIHQGHPPSSAMIWRELKTDRGISAPSREERRAAFSTSPSPLSIFHLCIASVTPPLLAGSSSGLGWDGTAWGILGAESRGAGMTSIGCWEDRTTPQTCARQFPRPSSMCRCALLYCFDYVVLIGVLQELL